MTAQGASAASVLKLLAEAEILLKVPATGSDLARHGINPSIALLALQGLVAYLEGDKLRGLDDLSTAADEIRARLER
jgi:hypothetical protein